MKAIANNSHEPEAKPRGGGWAAALLMEEESDAEVPDGPDVSQAEAHQADETRQAAANSEKEELAKTVMVQTMLMQQLQTQMQQAAMAQVAMAQSSHIQNNMPAGPRHVGGGSAKVPVKNLQQAKQYQNLMSKKGDNEETIFVGGLRKTTEEDQVFSHFSKFGPLESVDIKRTPDGTSRGFAFVKFKHKDGVDKALEKLGSHMIDNKWIAVRRRDDQSAHAGRAASIAKAAEPKQVEEAPPPEPEDREEDFTNKYLTMAQQLGMAQQQEQEQQVVGIVGAPVMMMSPMMSPMMASPMMGGPVMGQPNMMGNPMGASVRMEPYRNTR